MSPLPYIRYSFHSLRNHLFSRWIDRSADTQISSQWRGPQDVLSILLILGPDIIQRALAQLAGSHITPVVFSFGWVAYAFSALLAAFGNGRLVPEADFSAIVIGAKSGNQRSNRSWVIGRLLRDHEQRSSKLKYHNDKTYGKHEALRVTVFEVADSPKPGTIARDWVYYSGFVVAVAQLGMAAIPTILAKNWSIMMITVMGNVLALLQGAMPHWRKEKWAAPSNGGYTVSITQGNGSQHVMVVLANEFTGFDLEILAGGGRNIRVTRQELIYISSLTVCWTALLISVAGLSEDSWYLLAIGLMGIVHNVFAAACPRRPGALGLHLLEKEVISSNTVAEVLYETEKRYPLVGSSLISTFFTGGMRVSEQRMKFWAKAEELRRSYGLDELRVRVDLKTNIIDQTLNK